VIVLAALGEGEVVRRWLILTLLTLAAPLAGCVSVDAGKAGGASGGPTTSRWFVGVVRVLSPDRLEGLSAVDVCALGAGWDGGPWLGWKAGNWVIADPARCQLLIVIRSPAEARNARSVIAALRGKEACVADFAQTDAPGGESRRR
jgi:hypothetical protein